METPEAGGSSAKRPGGFFPCCGVLSPQTPGLGKTGQFVRPRNPHVFDPTVGQLGADLGPELRGLGLSHPNPKHMFDALEGDSSGDVRVLIFTW